MRRIAQILRKEYGLNAGSLEQEEDDDEEDGDDEEEEEEEEEEQELDAPRASHGSWGQMLANSEAEAASVKGEASSGEKEEDEALSDAFEPEGMSESDDETTIAEAEQTDVTGSGGAQVHCHCFRFAEL